MGEKKLKVETTTLHGGEKHLKVETKLGDCSSVAYANRIPFKLYLSLVNRMCLLRLCL